MKIAEIQILPANPKTFRSKSYAWAIGSAGYESRARHFFENSDIKRTHSEIFLFAQQRVISFEENRAFFKAHGFSELDFFDDISKDGYTIQDLLKRIHRHAEQNSNEPLSVLIDISSMTRQLIASLCFGLGELAQQRSIQIHCDFAYSMAKFGDLPELHGPIVSNGPVITKLAGWSPTPGVPCGLILGIGYEEDLALGVIEELEAGAVWGFRPKNNDPQYDSAIDEHNHGLFDTISLKRLVRYTPQDPYSLFVSLDQLASLSKDDFRILIIPFGPKIFALAACLVGMSNYPDVGVWRVSAGPNLKPVDRKPEGTLIGLTVVFSGQS